ncbi:MAG: DAK2 domain-containing protein [Bacteroidales bacterium]|nr:DAK2 domain-containing protein [Bacteroidales bacterium]
MEINQTCNLTGDLFISLINQGYARLNANRKAINDLNVFPIPDGDTGDNMCLTIQAGCSQASTLSGAPLGEVASAVSSGMLMGARGNSGVILSRIFAGMAKGLSGLNKTDTAGFAVAMDAAVKEAYGSVAHPVEGTILTVVREGAEGALPTSGKSFEEYLAALISAMEVSLEHTPEKLDVLREAGVVDSGGAGLLQIVCGFQDALLGISTDAPDAPAAASQSKVDFSAFDENTELKFGYCTEFLLRLQASKVDLATFDEKEIEDYILSAGDSVVFFREGTIIKVHVHTRTPGDILSHCQRWGEFLTIKIENMTLQHNHSSLAQPRKTQRKEYGRVTVASGEGMTAAFKDVGADVVISGGQTMNPSVADFVKAFDEVNASTIFVFPNNSNIILTAKQAAEVYSDARIVVIPTKDPGAGYVSLASFDPSTGSAEEIETALAEVAAGVVCGMVSTAIRDTVQNGLQISKGDFIGFRGDDILCKAAARNAAAEELCQALDAGSHDVALVFAGADAGQDTQALQESLSCKYPLTEFMFHDGGQAVFDYIIVLC